jgi:hypothetical protein
MFGWFSYNKAHYERGQVFPFLIGLLCILVILIMITVNLGQIGIFRTDVSNAADAAALSGASVLSGALLGLGLRSDMMCGYFVVAMATIIVECLFIVTIPAAIGTYIAFFVSQMADFLQAYGEGKMAWSNAKKTAVQYAFQNAGVDEPRPTFEEFVRNAKGVDPNTLGSAALINYYDEYTKGESNDARNYGRSGFARFMDDSKQGYWDEGRFGGISPLNSVAVRIQQGYGWTQADDGSFINSYDNGGNYRNYENWVEVEVIGSIAYAMYFYNPVSEIADAISEYVEDHIDLPWWLEWLDEPIQWLLSLVSWIWSTFSPAGLQLEPSAQEATDENYLVIRVTRHKRDEDLGLWRFRYGDVMAVSQSHAFRENGDETIKPLLFQGLWSAIQSLFDGGDWEWDWFDTSKHLFETEIADVY